MELEDNFKCCWCLWKFWVKTQSNLPIAKVLSPVQIQSLIIQFNVQVAPETNFLHTDSSPILTGRSFMNLHQVDRDIYFFISASMTPIGWQLRTDMYILCRLSTHLSIDFQLNIQKICTPHPMAVYLYFLWQAKTWIPSSAQSANVVSDNLLNSKNSRIDTRTATIRTELLSFLQALVDLTVDEVPPLCSFLCLIFEGVPVPHCRAIVFQWQSLQSCEILEAQ